MAIDELVIVANMNPLRETQRPAMGSSAQAESVPGGFLGSFSLNDNSCSVELSYSIESSSSEGVTGIAGPLIA